MVTDKGVCNGGFSCAYNWSVTRNCDGLWWERVGEEKQVVNSPECTVDSESHAVANRNVGALTLAAAVCRGLAQRVDRAIVNLWHREALVHCGRPVVGTRKRCSPYAKSLCLTRSRAKPCQNSLTSCCRCDVHITDQKSLELEFADWP